MSRGALPIAGIRKDAGQALMCFNMSRSQPQSRFVVFTRTGPIAVFAQSVCQVDSARGVVGVLRYGFRERGACRGPVSRLIKQRAEVVKRRQMRWFARKHVEVSVSGIGGAASFGQ